MISAKINSGAFRGSFLKLPPQSTTRAVSSKVRASIFNKLDVNDCHVLDLYAGGGTLGFEALSNGAIEVEFVDKSELAVKVLRQNSEDLGVSDKVKIISKDALNFCRGVNDKYDVIFLDPPYADFNNTLVKICSNLLQLGGILVVSCSSKSVVEEPIDTIELDEKNYGDTKIVYLQKQ